MSKIPYTKNTEVVLFRLCERLKEKLNQLAKKSKYCGSASVVLRALIEAEAKR